MVLRLVVASLFVTVSAYAQAPGEALEPGAGVGPGGVAPVVVVSPAPYVEVPGVMFNRWAVGLSIGSLSLAQRNTGDGQTQFNVGQLSFRYRATLHLELELALGGGTEQLADGTQGDRQVNMAALNLRYRFRPTARWNWWLMGGLGGVSVTEQDSSDQDRQNAQRPFMDVGVGLERRWQHFALHAELSALSVGPMKNEPMAVAQPGVSAAVSTPQPQPSMTSPTDNLAGGSLTIGASYYF